MSQLNPQVLRYLPADRLTEHLKELHSGMVVTHGHHEPLVPGFVKDLERNFYDELHHQCVHNTYHGLYRVQRRALCIWISGYGFGRGARDVANVGALPSAKR
jgi:hypothetical protein